MPSSRAPAVAASSDAPLDTFHRCHEGIIHQLNAATALAELADAAMRARRVAQDTLKLFESAVMPHHNEEEVELFPAVLRSALPEELETVKSMVKTLTEEHRDVEAQWLLLAPAVKKIAKGQDAEIDAAGLAELIRRYLKHARTEEEVFLPLAQSILGRNGNHMAALGMSMHMRHVPPVIGYI